MLSTALPHIPDNGLRRAVSGLISAGILAATLISPALARTAQAPQTIPSYAMVADLATASKAIAHVRIRSVTAVAPERSPGLRAGEARYYVEAESAGLIRGQDGIATRLAFLVDGPAEKARRPIIKGRTYLIFGEVGERLDQFRLLSSRALIPWSEPTEALTRRIVGETLATGAAPAITRIESAFHVAGSVTGESETQIFLQTQDKRPISLSIVSRPDEKPAYSVAIGEVVGESEGLPPPDTLLWYRLACHLPAQLPERALQGTSPAEAAPARADYAAFVAAMAPCLR